MLNVASVNRMQNTELNEREVEAKYRNVKDAIEAYR